MSADYRKKKKRRQGHCRSHIVYHTHLNISFMEMVENLKFKICWSYANLINTNKNIYFYLGQVGIGTQYQNTVDHAFKHMLKNIHSLKYLENIIFGNMVIFYQNCIKIHNCRCHHNLNISELCHH